MRYYIDKDTYDRKGQRTERKSISFTSIDMAREYAIKELSNNRSIKRIFIYNTPYVLGGNQSHIGEVERNDPWGYGSSEPTYRYYYNLGTGNMKVALLQKNGKMKR